MSNSDDWIIYGRMDELKKRIIKDGKVLPGNIIKVDGFLNHRVDTEFLSRVADEFKKQFKLSNVNLILTAEASGIPIATICSYMWKIPLVFAKKAKSDNIEGGLYKTEIISYTYRKKVTQIVSKEWMNNSSHVLIIDDFIARGESIKGLISLVKQAGATLEGIGVVIEKGFQGGGDMLRQTGYNYKALAIIDSVSSGKITFRIEGNND